MVIAASKLLQFDRDEARNRLLCAYLTLAPILQNTKSKSYEIKYFKKWNLCVTL